MTNDEWSGALSGRVGPDHFQSRIRRSSFVIRHSSFTAVLAILNRPCRVGE